MATLPSGLPELVADDESLSRFLTQSSHFNSIMAKPAAFLPSPVYKNTSVFRIGNEPDRLRATWNETATGERTLKGAAIFKAADVRQAQLDVIAKELPLAHANIVGWPWLENDPELQKARQKEMATQIASTTSVVVL
ncbi:hypothetical protein BH11VER1_BH11VER1_03260 [soil metagenome]